MDVVAIVLLRAPPRVNGRRKSFADTIHAFVKTLRQMNETSLTVNRVKLSTSPIDSGVHVILESALGPNPSFSFFWNFYSTFGTVGTGAWTLTGTRV